MKEQAQARVHASRRSSIGAFMYRGPYPSGNGETIENAYWTAQSYHFAKSALYGFFVMIALDISLR